MKYADAMKLARKGERVRCDSYMSPGWAVTWIKSAKGFFCINPHVGSQYQFTPHARDEEGEWNTQPRREWVALT